MRDLVKWIVGIEMACLLAACGGGGGYFSQNCVVTKGSGSVAANDIKDVAVDCSDRTGAAPTAAAVPAAAAAADSRTLGFADGSLQAHAMAMSQDGMHLYVAGDFTTVNGEKHERITALDIDETQVPRWHADVDARVSALALDEHAGVLYAGGSFTTVRSSGNQASRNLLVALRSADGEVLQRWDASLQGVGVDFLGISEGVLVAVGRFLENGGRGRQNFAAFRATKIGADGEAAPVEPLDYSDEER